MDPKFDLPDLADGLSVAEYAYELRQRFGSQRDVEARIPINAATISGYETGKAGSTAPLGYLACLATLLVEKATSKYQRQELDEYRNVLRLQLWRLVREMPWSLNFRQDTPFGSWKDLEASANAFLLKQEELRNRNSRPQQIQPQHVQTGHYMVPVLPQQGVIGRDNDLKNIAELLLLHQPQAIEVQPLALKGMGGVGKTTLAVALGRSQGVREMFPDGVLWAELGLDPVIRPIMNEWGRALGVDLLPELDERACEARLRDALFHKRVLLLVDDVWAVNKGVHFLVGGPRCRTVFTTLESPIAYALATRERTVKVDVLSLSASMLMLSILAPEAVRDDPAGAEKLCQRLECLPLAIKLAGRMLAIEADVPARMRKMLEGLIEHSEYRLELEQPERDIRIDEDSPVSLQAILGVSVNRLNQRDKERFAMLSVFGGEPLTWEINATTSIWECSISEAEDTTAQLIQRGLVEPRPEGRYWMHALLADYAEKLRVELDL
jgi:hypothetical protein